MAPFGGGATMGMEAGGTLAADLATRAIPHAVDWVVKHLIKRGQRAAATQVDRLLGINGRVTKFRRTQYPRLPRYKKGFERVSGFYGRFKSGFGKELKFFDSNINFNTVSDTWKPLQASTVSLNTIGRGTAPNLRIGRNFIMRSLNFRFFIDKTAETELLTYRIMIILDTQANGQNPTAAQIFAIPGPSINAWSSYRNLENISRFVVLWDKTYDLNSFTQGPGQTAFAAHAKNDSYYKKIAIKTEMSGNDAVATITDIKDNSISLWACSTSPSTSSSKIVGTFRIRFTG